MQTVSGHLGFIPTPARDQQKRLHSEATTKISLSGQLRWSGFYYVYTRGTNTTEPAGNLRIDMPADGAAIAVQGGASVTVVAATGTSPFDTGGIPLPASSSLYYRNVVGSGATSAAANFLIVPYTANTNGAPIFTESEDFILIATRDGASTYHMAEGDALTLGMQIGRSEGQTNASWAAMKQRVMGDGYFYSPGGNTAAPLAFGFTGQIRWIDGGRTAQVNTAGYLDANPAGRVAGTAIRGVGAASRAWRLMTAAEKPAWFGGAARSVNPILAASSTVVDLNENETLYYVPNIDSASAAGEYAVANYTADTTPVHWMPIASRQATGGQTTIQVLLGGVQTALRAGEAVFTSVSGEHFADASRRKITHRGIKHARFTSTNFFTGTGANGNSGAGTAGVMVSWANISLMYGISDGYASWGNQYTYIDVPPTGTQIPVVIPNSNVTRVVTDVGGVRFIPLAPWEALYFIPPAYTGGNISAAGDFVVGWYGANHHIPRNAVLVAKYEASAGGFNGSGIGKQRILFADNTYFQAGSSSPTGAVALYDQSHWSGEWRNVTVAGGTPPAGTAALPAVAGVVGNYPAQYVMQYRNLSLDDDPRGRVELKGLIQLNGYVAAGLNIAFIPGVLPYNEPILTAFAVGSVHSDALAVPVSVRFYAATVGGQLGTQIRVTGGGLTAANPLWSLGVNGGSTAASIPQWITFDNLSFPCN